MERHRLGQAWRLQRAQPQPGSLQRVEMLLGGRQGGRWLGQALLRHIQWEEQRHKAKHRKFY